MEKDERDFLGQLKITTLHYFFKLKVLSTCNFILPFPDPRSSLLTIGRIPMMNALQDYSRHFAGQHPPLIHALRDYQLSCRNTWAFPVRNRTVVSHLCTIPFFCEIEDSCMHMERD